jgi:GT2 family glycosyltransferase
MKVLITFLDYLRHEHTPAALKSLAHAGYPFDLITVDKLGVSAALNVGLEHALKHNYGAVVTMANDIVMPPNWLKEMVSAEWAVPNSGMIGIHTVEFPGAVSVINGRKVELITTPFGNVLIPIAAVRACGLFDTAFDPYGMQDSDYAVRLLELGFVNYYLHGLKAEHVGHDCGEKTAYRQMKDEGLEKAKAIWNEKRLR